MPSDSARLATYHINILLTALVTHSSYSDRSSRNPLGILWTRMHDLSTSLQTQCLGTLCRRGVQRDGALAERSGRLQRQGVPYIVPQKLAKNKDGNKKPGGLHRCSRIVMITKSTLLGKHCSKSTKCRSPGMAHKGSTTTKETLPTQATA